MNAETDGLATDFAPDFITIHGVSYRPGTTGYLLAQQIVRLTARLAAVERLADEWESDYPSESASCNREVDEWWLDLRDVLNTEQGNSPALIEEADRD